MYLVSSWMTNFYSIYLRGQWLHQQNRSKHIILWHSYRSSWNIILYQYHNAVHCKIYANSVFSCIVVCCVFNDKLNDSLDPQMNWPVSLLITISLVTLLASQRGGDIIQLTIPLILIVVGNYAFLLCNSIYLFIYLTAMVL